MIELLNKCTVADFEYLSGQLDSWVSFTDDKGRKNLLAIYKEDPTSENKQKLAEKLDKQIGYYASADLAFLYRMVVKGKGNLLEDEMIADVAKKLKVRLKPVGTTEAKLERMVKAVVEKELLSKSADELAEAFSKFDFSPKQTKEILDEIKKIGKLAIIPILVRVVGPKVVEKLVETIVVAILAQIIGREAAKVIFKEVAKRNPWVNALGPVVWAVSAAWLAFDLQGPAYRKTVPVCLYLGVVGLRDGPEDGEEFWQEQSEQKD